MLFVYLFLIATSVIVSTYFWESRSNLRLSPVIVSTLVGFSFAIHSDKVSGVVESIGVVLLMLAVGWGFYFSIWIQLRK